MDVRIRRRIDYVTKAIQHDIKAIEDAVLTVGIPLEDALVFFVRMKLQESASDLHVTGTGEFQQ